MKSSPKNVVDPLSLFSLSGIVAAGELGRKVLAASKSIPILPLSVHSLADNEVKIRLRINPLEVAVAQWLHLSLIRSAANTTMSTQLGARPMTFGTQDAAKPGRWSQWIDLAGPGPWEVTIVLSAEAYIPKFEIKAELCEPLERKVLVYRVLKGAPPGVAPSEA